MSNNYVYIIKCDSESIKFVPVEEDYNEYESEEEEDNEQ